MQLLSEGYKKIGTGRNLQSCFQSLPSISWIKAPETIEANCIGAANIFEAVRQFSADTGSIKHHLRKCLVKMVMQNATNPAPFIQIILTQHLKCFPTISQQFIDKRMVCLWQMGFYLTTRVSDDPFGSWFQRLHMVLLVRSLVSSTSRSQ